MAFMYMMCCITDFIIFPIMYTVVQAHGPGAINDIYKQWVPITLQGGGLFHLAMGTVIGVSSYGRTQETINMNNTSMPFGGLPNSMPNAYNNSVPDNMLHQSNLNVSVETETLQPINTNPKLTKATKPVPVHQPEI